MKQSVVRLQQAQSWLLVALFFCIPLSVAPAYILSAVLLVLCVAEGRFGEKCRILVREPLAWIFLAYFLVFVVSLLWTENMEWGLRMVRRQMFFLLFPIYLLAARREHLMRYVLAFLLSIAMCEVFAYYNFLQLHVWPHLPEGIRVDKDPYDTAPFVDRIMYAPALALAGYLALHQLLFAEGTRRVRLLYAILFLTTAGNLLISGGRAGMAGFLALVMLAAFQRYARRPVVAALISAFAAMAFLGGGYLTNDYFRDRANAALTDIQNYDTNPNTSLGQRATFAMNATRIFLAHPIAGVGVGDYPQEYEKMNRLHTPSVMLAWNPHNQYLYALTAAGIPGGVLLLLVLLVPLFRRGERDGREYLRKALPVLLATICLVESYLLRSNISLLYILFTAALWCQPGKARK
ncbi:MAG TPA: O-antigen ligase family protein [Noviherbaspirillum sp.]|jgi:O-antigen ligase|uniref:O-antigen ligase family protein n=1 Tax=Noviherbaspirillum sp. TaxID=1926288 RepID=UPI002F941DF0